MRRSGRLLVVGSAVMWSGVLGAISAAASSRAEVPDFCFLHVSDLHLSPLPAGEEPPPADRSVETIGWVCREAREGQRLGPSGVTTPPPAFVVATGDLTEYGVIGRTWEHFERCWEPLAVPLYVVAGNHDHTWTNMMPILRQRHGGDHYSFDRFGCHFVMIDSASIQEPVPSLEARTLNWLREDLKKVPNDRPVFVFQHHPLGSTEFATPIEQLRFLEVLRERHVALLLMGHGHGVRSERWNGVDSVMGGSTFGPNTGYGIISVTGGVLRATYRYAEEGKPMIALIEKPIQRGAAEAEAWEIMQPAAGAVISGDTLRVIGRGGPRQIRVCLNGDEQTESRVRQDDGGFECSLSMKGLAPGRHFVLFSNGGRNDRRQAAREFVYRPADSRVSAQQSLAAAGMKACPTVMPEGCLLATTGGQILRWRSGEPLESFFETGVEILHAPAVVDGILYVSSGEQGVFAVGPDGTRRWKRSVGAAVYGTPAVAGDAVYVGDLEGFVHGIDRATGALRWSKRHATFSIEMPVVVRGDMLYAGAWDGYLYAIRTDDGSLAWKQRGPAGQTGERVLQSRYYAPADCPPVLAGSRLFVCDRSYRLGSYSLDGEYLGLIAEGVSGIGLSEDGRGFFARGLERGLARYDDEGRKLWTADVPMGRFPIPPTAAGGRVYACSNRGLLSVVDAGDGKVLSRYQVSPQLHVMAPVGADREGRAYVAGMDGTLSVLDLGLQKAE